MIAGSAPVQEDLQATITPLLIYRLAFAMGALLIFADGAMTDEFIVLPDWVLSLRRMGEFATLAVVAASFTSDLVRRHIGLFGLATAQLIIVYSASVAIATSQGINEVLGNLMVLCASSAVFHRIHLMVANLAIGSFIFLAMAYPVVDPEVSYQKYALSVCVFALFFMLLMVSNLHARNQRERSERAANAWFDNSADALIYGDVATERVKRVNPSAVALFETEDPREIIESIVGGILSRDPQSSRATLLAEAADAEALDDVVEFTTAKGNRFWGALALRKLKISDEALTLVRITDVSARVAHEEALEAAREAAENAALTRTRFLANMSHEIRTPMNGVIGMASLMQETRLDDQQQGYLKTIRTSGEALLAIINEILDFSKIDADQVQLDMQTFDLATCARDALDVVAPAAADKGLSLNFEIEPALRQSYRGDVNRIRQVLVNLLSNAVKFTADGSVTLRVASNAEASANIVFHIIDTGIGIPADQQLRLFDPFSQADASTTREYGGTGLGLSISKRLAELMGGDIEVASTPGEGSCFSFTLMLSPALENVHRNKAVKTVAELPALNAADISFLLAEDNVVNQTVALQMLNQLGARADVAVNGREAVELQQQRSYDIVLMDVQMPEIDGLEASMLIRQSSVLAQPYIIAMTANAMNEDRDACLAAGMNDFLAKPVRLEDLHQTLSQALQSIRDSSTSQTLTKQ
jgi:signal transduction histidine kinase/CheY-like chemotaxis protein